MMNLFVVGGAKWNALHRIGVASDEKERENAWVSEKNEEDSTVRYESIKSNHE